MKIKNKATTGFSILVLFLSMLVLIMPAKAQQGALQVYIINLSGVGDDNTTWVTNRADIVYGALNACSINGKEMNLNVPWFHADEVSYPQYYDVRATVITNWYAYQVLIETAASNDREGLIFMNTHGEIFPVPNGFTKEAWMGVVANLMLHYRATWISTSGYPFYTVAYQNGTRETWGITGFDYFMSFINLQGRQCWPPNGDLTAVAPIDASFLQQVGGVPISEYCFR